MLCSLFRLLAVPCSVQCRWLLELCFGLYGVSRLGEELGLHPGSALSTSQIPPICACARGCARSTQGISHSLSCSAEAAALPRSDQMHSALTNKSGTVLKGAGWNQQQRGKIKGNVQGKNGTKESFKSTWLWIYMYLLLRGMRGVAAFKRIHIFSGFWIHIAPRKILQWAEPPKELWDENEF